ncbi:MAG: heparinase II/III family protein [Candidatus Latescibacteria bacterium]|nr:heparinase II/III family protein [Candidatus Latescibacterota bacterium]
MDWKYIIDNVPSEEAPAGDQMLASLKAGHPRIMINENTVTHVQHLLKTESQAPRWYEHLKAETDAILIQPPSHYEIPDGKRLLAVSRAVKERVRALMFIHMLEGGDAYVDRVWAEIDVACQFQDWNPSHFLDTAEMTYAVAMAYDWLFDQWSDDQRKVMRDAIVKKGLTPGMRTYRGEPGMNTWHKNHRNWNQVCNGGLSIGALAIADEEPELAKKILHEGIKSVPLPMVHYAPDGAGTEGATYWDFGSRYNILYLSSLETALGTDFGLSEIPGFKESGQYQMYISGPSRLPYDFGDCGMRRLGTAMHFWMGKRFAMPEYSWFRYSELMRPDGFANVLDFLWFDESGRDFDPSTLALDKLFRGAEVAAMRSSWTDERALAIGFQAGSNANLKMHRHVDLGTFILEASGERWIIEAGKESETYQLHQNKCEKWAFYRMRAEGHNIPLFNPDERAGQKLDGVAPITSFSSTPDLATAVVDLSDPYGEYVHRLTRTFEMRNRSSVVLTEEMEAKDCLDVWWFLHTSAEIVQDSNLREAKLMLNGKMLRIRIEDGSSSMKFDVMDALPLSTSPNPDQAENVGIKKLMIHAKGLSRYQLTVSFTPL